MSQRNTNPWQCLLHLELIFLYLPWIITCLWPLESTRRLNWPLYIQVELVDKHTKLQSQTELFGQTTSKMLCFKVCVLFAVLKSDFQDIVLALFSYCLTSTKTLRMQLHRFPNQNRYISQYIFSMTGVKRSAKQVGSHLQQLQETCTDPMSKWIGLGIDWN